MSTVTNPYTFNIKSNCRFSTIVPIGESTYLTKIAMEYYHETNAATYFLRYSNGVYPTSLEPNIINGISILSIQLIAINMNSVNRFVCQVTTSGKRYSKIILKNNIAFSNIEVQYNTTSDGKDIYMYDGNPIGISPGNWPVIADQMQRNPFDLTIEFIP